MPIIKVFSKSVGKSTKGKRRLAKLMMVIVGLLFGVLVAEIALRVVGYSYPLFFQTDFERGYALIPNVEGWSWPEQKSYVKINSDGFRDREHTKEKPPGTIRIAVLGDSFTEARAVSSEAAFPSVLERELTRSGRNVEVMNFGVTGYGTVEELLTLRQRVWAYSPDIVVLAVCTYNDITDNYKAFKNADEIPYFSLSNGTLVADDSFRQSKKYLWSNSAWFKAWTWLHNSSRLIQLIHHAQFALRTRISAWKVERNIAQQQKSTPPDEGNNQKATSELIQEIGVQNIIFREPVNDDEKNAWAVTEALIGEMSREVADHNAEFVLVTVTADIQVYPDVTVRQAMMDRLKIPDLFYPDRRLGTFAQSENIPFLDLAEPMQQAADRNKVYFHGFGNAMGNGHWNEAGHKFAGESVAQKINELLLGNRPS